MSSSILAHVLKASGFVSAFHALGHVVLKEGPISPHLMRNVSLSLETVTMY